MIAYKVPLVERRDCAAGPVITRSGLAVSDVRASTVQGEPARWACVLFVIPGECAAQTGIDERAHTHARKSHEFNYAERS